MIKKFYPSQREKTAYTIDYDALYREGFRNIIFDIDNTLVNHGYPQNEESLKLLTRLKEIGFKYLFLSNNKEPRVKSFAEPVGALYIYKAHKPDPSYYVKAAEKMGGSIFDTVLIGDQIFTDVWGANLSGMRSILVSPLNPKEEIQIVLKRKLEWFVLKSYDRHVAKDNKEVNADIKRFCVIGYPVAHSLSPMLHGGISTVLGDNILYLKNEVKPEDLSKFVDEARKDYSGFNVTVPHKENIMGYLDEISLEAQNIGAVNTVVNKDGRLLGFNTDVYGFIKSLENNKINISGKIVLVYGAGGASKAVIYALSKLGASSFIINRTYDKAEKLAKEINTFFDGNPVKAITEEEALLMNERFICVQATNVGLKPLENQCIVANEKLWDSFDLCYDLIPVREKTLFLKKADERKIPSINGMDMLFYQALAAYELWFDKKISKVNRMYIKRMINL